MKKLKSYVGNDKLDQDEAMAAAVNKRKFLFECLLGAVHMSQASPANRADSILSRPVVA